MMLFCRYLYVSFRFNEFQEKNMYNKIIKKFLFFYIEYNTYKVIIDYTFISQNYMLIK